jgi:hypothetical protein
MKLQLRPIESFNGRRVYLPLIITFENIKAAKIRFSMKVRKEKDKNIIEIKEEVRCN